MRFLHNCLALFGLASAVHRPGWLTMCLAAAPRRISYMAKIELFRIPVLGPLIRALGAVPVDPRGSPGQHERAPLVLQFIHRQV